MFTGTYAPQDWLFCDGTIYMCNQYPALYALIGNTYGGDDGQTFRVPDFTNMVPMGWGNSAGLTSRPWGTTGGESNFPITPDSMPQHNHAVNAISTTGTVSNPAGAVFAGRGALDRDYVNTVTFPDAINTPMYDNSLQLAGVQELQPLPMQQPYCAMNFIICAQNGIWPPKP